jgi:hypothetical protein
MVAGVGRVGDVVRAGCAVLASGVATGAVVAWVGGVGRTGAGFPGAGNDVAIDGSW